jgi:hypothetical protein
MLPLHGKHGVVISRIPVMQNGLGASWHVIFLILN